METKKCPKCGAEIPVEMSFCLHCMERTDGVLEIRKKVVPSRKYIITVMIAFAIMTAIIVLLILSINRKNNTESSDTAVNTEAAETSADSAYNTSDEENAVSAEPTGYVSTAAEPPTTSKKAETDSVSANTPTNKKDTVQNHESAEESHESEEPREDAPPESEQSEEQSPVPQETTVNEPAAEQTSEENIVAVDFQEVFTQRLNSWGASHVLTDTLSFSENGCTFTSNVGTDEVNCAVTANSDMTDFTLTIEPTSEYTNYSTSIYIPDIVNEITYFVLDYRMSSSMRTDIALMFENFESEGSFAENELNCNISTQAHNNGSYPVTVNCCVN
ncbi:MAG: hypothetical protein J6B75_09650 [Ruminococcus sp.]|nr:hypothetical protein [Ruminococcus sp.]